MKVNIVRWLIVFVVCLMLLLSAGTQALAAGASIKLDTIPLVV